MYFSAFPLLLLVASTICASPVYIKGRVFEVTNDQLRAQVMEKEAKAGRSLRMYREFYGLSTSLKPMKEWIQPIKEWSNPDEVVEPLSHIGVSIIMKRVDLSTVVVPDAQSLANGQGEMEKAQRMQIFEEIEALERARLLHSWCQRQEKSEDGKKKPVFYIGIMKEGVPASQSTLTEEELEEARKNGMNHYGGIYHVVPRPEYNKNEYFSFSKIGDKPFGTPIYWRYAIRV